MGKGKPALKYLARYLYRGVMNERDIVSNNDGDVTFKYVDSETGKTCFRSLKGEDFCWLVLQQVLQVMVELTVSRPGPVFKCPRCQAPM